VATHIFRPNLHFFCVGKVEFLLEVLIVSKVFCFCRFALEEWCDLSIPIFYVFRVRIPGNVFGLQARWEIGKFWAVSKFWGVTLTFYWALVINKVIPHRVMVYQSLCVGKYHAHRALDIIKRVQFRKRGMYGRNQMGVKVLFLWEFQDFFACFAKKCVCAVIKAIVLAYVLFLKSL
jgi:hypothetical protein